MDNRELRIVSEKEWYYGELNSGEAQDGIGLKKERDGSVFYGGWKDGLREGYGVLGEADGSLRIGNWVADKFDGFFMRIWPLSDSFCIFFGKTDNMTPKEGTLVCNDGRLYHGLFTEFRNNEFNGEGALVWPNKRIYAGRWKNGGTDIGGVIRKPDTPDGRLIGTLSNVRNGFVAKSWPQESEKQFFFGITEDDEIRNANGILFYQNGEFFAGEMTGGQRNGLGLLRSADGEFFYGKWENGNLTGNGVYINISDGSITCYVGVFEKTQFDGNGCIIERKGSVWDYVYSGDWQAGKKSGAGLLNTGDKGFFIGQFLDDLKDGICETVFEDGSRSSMSWKKGAPDISLDSVREPGPVRALYKEDDDVNKATINSLERYSDVKEMEFLGIRASSTSDYKREMLIEPGCDYEVRVFYHNCAKDGGDEAKETRLKAYYSKNVSADQDGCISASFSSENTETSLVWDGIKLYSKEPIALNYKIASAKIWNRWKSNGRILPQALFSDDGIYIGTDALDGNLPAGEVGQVTFIIHAGGNRSENSVSFSDQVPKAQPSSVIENSSKSDSTQSIETNAPEKKKKRSRLYIRVTGATEGKEYEKKVSADLGEEIHVKIDFTNSASQQDISISAAIPPVCEYVSGSTYLELSNGLKSKQDDSWVRDGIVLTDFMSEGEGAILFSVRYYPQLDNKNIDNKLLVMLETAYISMRGEMEIESL